MPIPSPEERPDLYDDMDCRPGQSAYPPKGAARGRERLRRMLEEDPETRDLAQRLRPAVPEAAE